MKDEINKIIQSISDFYKLDNALKYYLDRHKAQILLDYITNLQEENEYSNYCNKELRKKITNLEYKIERLEENNKNLKDLCDKYEEEHNNAFKLWTMKMEEMPDYEERMNYKSRNEKAIEYINKYKNQNWYIESRFTEELLNILQGVDKE